jgi:hypothetical protein
MCQKFVWWAADSPITRRPASFSAILLAFTAVSTPFKVAII